MTNEEMIRGLDATIDALIKRKATNEEAEETIRALYRPRREPRQWDSADISYEEPA